MAGFSLSIFYYVYLGFVLIFLLFTFFNIYHLVRFGPSLAVSTAVIAFYIVVSIFIFQISWQYIASVDWKQTIPILIQLSI